MKNVLWYKEPAVEWEEALPLGNGNIGAMVFGRTENERIALNDDTLWSGYPKNKHNPDAREYLPKVQEKLLQGRIQEAQELSYKHLAGEWTEAYLPLGDLNIHTELAGDIDEYYRDLNIQTAIATTAFTCRGVSYRREIFVSAPAKALVMRLTASSPMNVDLTLESQLHSALTIQDSTLYMRGRAPEQAMPSYYECENPVVYNDGDDCKAMRFVAALAVSSDGLVTGNDGVLRVEGAREILCRLYSATSFNGFGQMPDADEEAKLADIMTHSAAMGYEALKEEHLKDFQALFDRVDVDFGHSDNEKLPIPQRMKAAYEGAADPDLAALLFQYGRYLMISGSREGTTPANLQGIWNQHLRAPWSSNYTININTQMNYWLAETCNLSDCAEPLIQWLGELAKQGEETARCDYGARGWVAHHNSDIWAHTVAVGDPEKKVDVTGYAIWPMGSGWLCEPLWEHYRFSGDTEYLREKALPVMMSAARFYLDFLIPDGNGQLVTAPSISPENTYRLHGERCHMDVAPTMDISIIKELFQNCLEGAAVVGIDNDITAEIREALPKLPEYKIGQYGQLQEWSQDYEEDEIGHRHVSHLYGLYPSDMITPEGTPELAKACEASLLRRGFEGTGWSLAWKVCLWARLGNGENAYRLIRRQLKPVITQDYNYSHGGGCYSSLLGAHPPYQIDGNYGVAAGIAEMLVQSHGDEIVFLPALPAAWKSGYARGLKVRGGKTVDVRWENGEIIEKKVY